MKHLEIISKEGKIEIGNKAISELDKFVFEITSKLAKLTDYVIVSGYIAILFGRSRTTEDIDILIKPIEFSAFVEFLKDISKDFWVINPGNAEVLYGMLTDSLAIRIARKNEIIPNAEIKFAQKIIDMTTLENSIEVIINNKNRIRISPLELQIAYKLFLGSEKDILDAVHLYELLKSIIDLEKINYWISYLGVDKDLVKKIIGASK